MGFKFRKRVKIAPGVNLNIGKKGVSTSLGGNGATVNISKRGVKTTVGIQGTGMSWSKNHSSTHSYEEELPQQNSVMGRIGNFFSALENLFTALWYGLLGLFFLGVACVIGWVAIKVIWNLIFGG